MSMYVKTKRFIKEGYILKDIVLIIQFEFSYLSIHGFGREAFLPPMSSVHTDNTNI